MTALERAARAVYESSNPQGMGWDRQTSTYKNLCRARVRAVLMAVRDGSPEVSRQVARAAWHSGSGQNPAVVWASGIDAILNEPPAPGEVEP